MRCIVHPLFLILLSAGAVELAAAEPLRTIPQAIATEAAGSAGAAGAAEAAGAAGTAEVAKATGAAGAAGGVRANGATGTAGSSATAAISATTAAQPAQTQATAAEPAPAARAATITGRVTHSEDRTPLPGCVIEVKHTRRRAVTGTEGRYRVEAAPSDTLCFRFLGCEPQEITVGNRTRIDVVLAPDTTPLEEVTVVAYGAAQKTRFTGSACAECDFASEPRFGGNTEEYPHTAENRFRAAADQPLSTFALECDGASYANCRRMLTAGTLPEPDAVRVEEFVNYFPYRYPAPAGDEPLALTARTGPCPWNDAHRLVRIGLRAREVGRGSVPPSNIVCLIDVSGSMSACLPLVKASVKMLTDNLRPEDLISVVTYASGVEEVLTGVPGSERRRIKDAVDALSAHGSTAGGAGLELAYEVARRHFLPGGNNRIVLCTDGDFNVGRSSDDQIETLVERYRKSTGVMLSVLGYGRGNYKDRKMQLIAERGNGNYAYVDDMREAARVLFREFGATMWSVANDVKMQVEFNPAEVASYRLVGYESRLLEDRDFNDDTRDAGEIGAGRCVTALYEIIPVGAEEHPAGTVDPLKYGRGAKAIPADEDRTAARAASGGRSADGSRTAALLASGGRSADGSRTAALTASDDCSAEDLQAAVRDVSGILSSGDRRISSRRDDRGDGRPDIRDAAAASGRNKAGDDARADISGELLTVKVRYKLPGEDRSRLMLRSLTDDGATVLTGDFAFAAAVAMFGQLLRVSDFRGDATWDDVTALAASAQGDDPGGYRREFLDLVRIAQSISRDTASELPDSRK